MAATTLGNLSSGTSPELLDAVKHRLRRGQREGELLRRRRARLLQMVGAHIGRVPFRHFPVREHDHVLDEPQGGVRREHISAAREILLDDVVLRRAGQLGPVRALLVREGDIERQHPSRGRVDRHRGVHLAKRDAIEQGAHVAEMGHGHADLSYFAAGQLRVGVVAGLGRQIEGDGQARLPLGQVLPIKLVRSLCR